MKKIALTFTAIALAMGATAAQAAPATQRFQCQKQFNLTVKKAGKDRVSLYVANPMNKRTTLKLTPAGSGELYTNPNGIYGNDTELHIKGKQANFTFTDTSGNEVSLACRAR